MKKMAKILSVILMVIMMLTISTNVLAAADTGDLTPGKMTGSADVKTQGIQDFGNKIVTILTSVGIVLSVIVLIVLGIKYMMGSAEEKAEYKKTLMPYIIGAALIFAASTIATVVYNFF